MKKTSTRSRLLCWLPLPGMLAAACGDDARIVELPPAGLAAPPAAESSAVYVIESLIFGDEGQFSYVLLLPSLDVGPTLTLDRGREFPDYAPADPVGDKLAVASGDQPTLTFYSITDELAWVEQGALSFARFTSLPLEANLAVSERKAYVPFDTTNHGVYDLATLEVGAEVGAPGDIPLLDGGLPAYRGYGHLLRGTTLFQPYYYASDDFHAYAPRSRIAAIDVASDELGASLEVPCPHLHITTADEQGNLYFSNGQGSIAAAILTPGHAPNCFARVNAGEQAIAPSSVTYFRDLAGGREGSNLFYIGDGKALFNVYHAERDQLSAETPFETVDFSSSYHLWTLDLATGEAAMLEGLDYSGGQFVALRIDGRTLITIPEPDYSSTAFYEVSPSGAAVKLFDVEGWAFKAFRLR